jgi:hypothetical protein
MSAHLHGPNCSCFSRRRLLGAGLMGLAGLALPVAANASGKAQALVLNCMDFRLVDEGVQYFNARGLRNNYDQVILAGASIGALGKLGPEWAATFWKHVDTAIALHKIEKLIVLDHRDCGAYKIVFGADSIADREIETALHRSQMILLREELRKRQPSLGFEGALMGLNGWVENLFPGEGSRVDYRPRPKPKPQPVEAAQAPQPPAVTAEAAPPAPAVAPQPVPTDAVATAAPPPKPSAPVYPGANVPIETAAPPAPVTPPPAAPAVHTPNAAIGSPAPGGHGH